MLATQLEVLRMAMVARLDEGEVAALWDARNGVRSIVVAGDRTVLVSQRDGPRIRTKGAGAE